VVVAACHHQDLVLLRQSLDHGGALDLIPTQRARGIERRDNEEAHEEQP
jgi:hypothetical protein